MLLFAPRKVRGFFVAGLLWIAFAVSGLLAQDEQVTSFSFFPSNPVSDSDQIQVLISGNKPTPCHDINLDVTEAGSTILIQISFIPPPVNCIFWVEPYDTSITIGPFAAGTYDLILVGYATIDPFVDPDLILIVEGANCGLSIDCSNTVAATTGNSDGCATIDITAGTSPYDLSWSGPVSGSDNTSLTSYKIPNLSGGDYNLTVTDADGCEDTTVRIMPCTKLTSRMTYL